MVADANVVIGIKGDLSGARRIKRTLDDVGRSADGVTRETDRLDRQMQKTNRTAQLFGRALGAIGGTLAIRSLGRVSDQFTVVDTNIRNVTSSVEEYDRVFNSLFRTAQENGDVFSGLAETYQKLNVSLTESVRQSVDLTKVTEILSRGFAASGTAAQTAAGASLQLTQGLATNFQAAGQELNSIIEGAPLLAKAIAVELGGNGATDLKRFAEAGTLTSKTFLDALIAAEDAVNEFEIPATISRSVQRVRNEFLRLAGESQTMRSISLGVGEGFNFVAENLDTMFGIMTVGFGAFAGYITVTQGLTAATWLMTGATLAFNAAVLANPLALFAAALGAVGTAAFVFREEIFESLRTVELFGVDATDVIFLVKNTAIEVFRGLADILTLPFRITLDTFKSTIAQLKIAANSIPRVNFEVSDAERQLASQNFGQIAARLTGDTFRRIGQTGQRIRQATDRDIAGFANTAERTEPSPFTPAPFNEPPIPPSDTKSGRSSVERISEETRELESIIKSTRTEQETLLDRVDELNRLKSFAQTAEEAEAIDRALLVANQQLETASTNIPDLKDGFEGLREGAKEFSNSASDAFGEVITGAKSAKEAISELLSTLAQDIATEGFSSLIGTILNGAGGSGSGGGLIGTITGALGDASGGGLSGVISSVGSLIGFNSGGDMVLGGNAGIDNNILSLNGSPIARTGRGETMSIRPAGVSGSSAGSGVTVIQNINVSTGVQETVQAELVAFLPTIEMSTKAAIAEDRQRGIS